MSYTKKESIDKNQYKITFTIEKEAFDKAEMAAYKKNVAKMNIPGFRKGKAPKAIVEKMYGKGVFYEEAINECLPAAFEEAAKASKLDIVGQPEFDIDTIGDDGVIMTAKVFVKPEVTIEGYKGIEVTKTVKTASDEDVDADLKRTQDRHSRLIEVTDRACALEDTVNIDYEGSVDGVLFDGGAAQGHDLKLGSGSFIPGFEDQIVGKNIGDEFDVCVTFPEEYHAKDLAGKAAVFKTKVNAIKTTELPALDDEFAKDVSEFDTLDEYKADLKAKIQARYDKEAENEIEEQLVNALIEKVQADIPEVMFVQETENYVRDYDNRLRMQGLDLKTYFQYTGQTLDSLREQMRPQAERQVKLRLALEKIASLEKVSALKKDVEAEYKRISEAYNVPVDQVKSMIDSKDVAQDLKVKGAMDLVKENATVKEA